MVGRNKSFWIGLFSITFRGELFVSGNVSSIGIIFAPSSFAFQFYFARGTKSLAFEGLVLWRSEYWYKDDSWIFLRCNLELTYRCCLWQWWHWFCFNAHHDNDAAAAVAVFWDDLGGPSKGGLGGSNMSITRLSHSFFSWCLDWS